MVKLLKVAMMVLSLVFAVESWAADLVLTWQDNSNAETGQEIQSCTGAGCTNFLLQTTVPANVQTFTDTNLAEKATKCYRIRAVDSANPAVASNFSNTGCGTTRLNQASGLSVAN